MVATIRAKYSLGGDILHRSGLIAALDIGSSKVACLIASIKSNGLCVIGAALHESRGVHRGAIVNLELAEQAIREVVAAAESQADARIEQVIISVNCGRPANLTANVTSSPSGVLITDEHLYLLAQQASQKLSLDGHTVIQRAIASYIVDEVHQVTGPLGMYCERLELAMRALAVKTSPLANIQLAVERANLSISGTVFGGFASGIAVLTEDEKRLGATVIEMGGGVTSIAVFVDGRLAHADLVPLGGEMITSDLARVLGLPQTVAERMKTLYGAAIGDGGGGAELVSALPTGELSGENTNIPRSLVSKIIQARLTEIFSEVRRRLTESGY